MRRASNPNPLNDDTQTNDNELHQQLSTVMHKIQDRLFTGDGYYYESKNFYLIRLYRILEGR